VPRGYDKDAYAGQIWVESGLRSPKWNQNGDFKRKMMAIDPKFVLDCFAEQKKNITKRYNIIMHYGVLDKIRICWNVNLINILRAAFLLIFFRQKII